jgi:outer membrane lipoprotein-sorting protein
MSILNAMKRRTLLAGLAAGLVLSAPLPAAAKPLSLDEISAYLQGLTTARGRFAQINADGSKSQGTFYLHRPGRMRFEYDAPDPALVVAGGGSLAIFDRKSNQGPQVYPLSETPLNVFLSRQIDLKNNPMIIGHEAGEKATSIIAQDPEHPEYGTIRLVFTSGPTALRQWVITDQSGQQTAIVLGELTEGEELSSFLFNRVAIEEQLKRGRN